MSGKNETEKVLLRITNLKQYFPLKKQHIRQEQLYVRANDGITLDIYEGETFGLVGESGCGKSTFGRVILQLYHQTEGRTVYYGETIQSFLPHYVKNTYDHLEKCRRDVKKQEMLRNRLQKAGEDLKGRDLEKYVAADKKYREMFEDLVRLIGGFYTIKELRPVSEILNAQYSAGAEIEKLRTKYNRIRLSGNKAKAIAKEKKRELSHRRKKKIAKWEQRLARIQKSIDLQTERQKSWSQKLEDLRHTYDSEPEFQQYEAYLDNGVDLGRLSYNEMRRMRKEMQLIFQDPYSSLNPRMTAGQIISEGLITHGFYKRGDPEIQANVKKVMEDCGLPSYMIYRYPHQFSGGQRQRIGIARSLAIKPKFIVCDEAVSALDVSIQSQIVNLLKDLKQKEKLTYLFISHDLSVVKYISDRIGVMYLGNLVELADTEMIFHHPLHPYTEALLLAIPTTDPGQRKTLMTLEGDIPSPIHPPEGCKFHTRCKYCTEICKKQKPEFREVEKNHFVACHHLLDHPVKL